MAFHPDISDETRDAIIKSDCDYYIGGKPAGKLTRGQRVVVLDRYNLYGFDVHVEVETVDGKIKGQVYEDNLNYLDGTGYDFWFKNILLVREYYYTETVDNINANSGYTRSIGQDNAAREREIRLWRAFYSEERMRISERYLVIGNDEMACAYRLHSVDKKGNTYTLHLSEYPKTKIIVTLIDNGNSIMLTYFVSESKLLLDLVTYSLNFKYVPYNKEKSEKVRNAVMTWCDEQIKFLSQNKQ